ncbi:MAG: hypothetical protein CMK92_05090 [Pseudomonas sp.]|nr:hypothetical protein [Pseudomonas sp.]
MSSSSEEKSSVADIKISAAKFKNQFVEFFGIMAMGAGTGVIGVVDKKTGKHHLPWNCPEDLAAYHKYIKHSVVIVGSTTFKVSPEGAFGDSPVVVLGKDGPNPTPADAIRAAVKIAAEQDLSKVAIIGGSKTYQTFWDMGIMKFMQVHQIDRKCANKKFYRLGTNPMIDSSKFSVIMAPNFVRKAFSVYDKDNGSHDTKLKVIKPPISDNFTAWMITKNNPTEAQFGEMLLRMSNTANLDRTGHGRIFATAGQQITHDMSHGIPHEIMRRPAFKMISAELRAIMSGVTSTKTLRDMGVYVWDANTTEEAQAKNARDTGYPDDPLAVDDIGASYGWNATNFGVEYPGADAVLANSGFLADVAKHLVVADSSSKTRAAHQWLKMVRDVCADVANNTMNCRIRMSLWDPTQRCALTPCMEQFQVIVRRNPDDDTPYLDLIIGQRSSDSLLAGHWNLTYGYLMADMLARIATDVTGVQVQLGMLTWNVGNAHYYGNQREAFEETLHAYGFILPQETILSARASNSQFYRDAKSGHIKKYPTVERDDVYMRVVSYEVDAEVRDYVETIAEDPVHRAILTYLSGGTYHTCGFRPKKLITSELPMNT